MQIRPGHVFSVPFLPDPIEAIATIEMGSWIKLIGKGLKSGLAHEPILAPDQIAALHVSAEREPFDADPWLFWLGIEAHRLGLTLEYDPYFSLSIAREQETPAAVRESGLDERSTTT